MSSLDFESALASVDWTEIYNTQDPNIVLDIILKNVNASLDAVAPLKKIIYRHDKPNISLRRDTLAAMKARNIARKANNKSQFKYLRNIVNKLVKRDKIQSSLSRLGSSPCPSRAWQEVNRHLGKGCSSLVPECTNNTDPNMTADNQNSYFVNKIEKLVESIDQSSAKNLSVLPQMSPILDHKKNNLNHWVSDLKPCKCKVCGKIYQEKPNKCDMCGTSFSTASQRKFSFKFVNASNITKIISRLNNTKALGVDELGTDVLKKGVISLAGPIARMCNLSLSTGDCPGVV